MSIWHSKQHKNTNIDFAMPDSFDHFFNSRSFTLKKKPYWFP